MKMPDQEHVSGETAAQEENKEAQEQQAPPVEHIDLNRIQSRKRQEAALRKQRQYIQSLSPEDREKIYAKKRRPHVEIKPKTPKEKLANFWYHYKWVTIASVVGVALVVFFIYDLVTKEKYDFEVLFATASYYDSEAISEVFDETDQYATDLDGDGTPNVSVMYVNMDQSQADSGDPNYYMAQFVKFSTAISGGEDAVLILDQANYDMLMEQDESLEFADLSQYSDSSAIEGDKYYIKDDPILGELDQGNDLFIVLKQPEDMKDQSKEKNKENYEAQVAYLTNLMNQTPAEAAAAE